MVGLGPKKATQSRLTRGDLLGLVLPPSLAINSIPYISFKHKKMSTEVLTGGYYRYTDIWFQW